MSQKVKNQSTQFTQNSLNTDISSSTILNCYVILLAAGSGSRLRTERENMPKKQFITYQNAPLWWHSVEKFHKCPHIKGIVLVFPHDDEEYNQAVADAKKLHSYHNIGLPFYYAKGGEKRHNSVYNGLYALPQEVEKKQDVISHVLIHDSARPFFSPTLVHTMLDTMKKNPHIQALVPAIELSDTVKIIHENKDVHLPNTINAYVETDKNNTIEVHTDDSAELYRGKYEKITPQRDTQKIELVVSTPPRHLLRAVQTPQAFRLQELKNAHEKIKKTSLAITDDAMVMEYYGHQVYLIQGETANTKITHPKDLDLLETQKKQLPCSGFGYDVHRFGGNRPFILGGISIPTDLKIQAHSDGDVLLHALMDALLSCLCLGDIGTHFPDTDKKFENISSSLLLDHVMGLWKKSELTLCHVDLTIITQKPKIAPFAQEITKNIARLLSISPVCINTKATTEEKLGFTGEGLGIKAVALVSALKQC